VEHEEHLMPDLEAYNLLADQWAYIATLVEQASRDADMLMVPIPQALARATADILTFPTQIREVGARRTGTWGDPPAERHDEEPAGDGPAAE
jgi:hypothetical protein